MFSSGRLFAQAFLLLEVVCFFLVAECGHTLIDSRHASSKSELVFCRLSESYRAATGAPYLSATYGNNIDAQWPLCPYEARGSCRNLKCPYQMTSDYTLEAVHIVRDIFITAQRSDTASDCQRRMPHLLKTGLMLLLCVSGSEVYLGSHVQLAFSSWSPFSVLRIMNSRLMVSKDMRLSCHQADSM